MRLARGLHGLTGALCQGPRLSQQLIESLGYPYYLKGKRYTRVAPIRRVDIPRSHIHYVTRPRLDSAEYLGTFRALGLCKAIHEDIYIRQAGYPMRDFEESDTRPNSV